MSINPLRTESQMVRGSVTCIYICLFLINQLCCCYGIGFDPENISIISQPHIWITLHLSFMQIHLTVLLLNMVLPACCLYNLYEYLYKRIIVQCHILWIENKPNPSIGSIFILEIRFILLDWLLTDCKEIVKIPLENHSIDRKEIHVSLFPGKSVFSFYFQTTEIVQISFMLIIINKVGCFSLTNIWNILSKKFISTKSWRFANKVAHHSGLKTNIEI